MKTREREEENVRQRRRQRVRPVILCKDYSDKGGKLKETDTETRDIMTVMKGTGRPRRTRP